MDNIVNSTLEDHTMNYFKSIRDPKKLDEIPIDILKDLYLEALKDLNEFKTEHYIMKRFIYSKDLWNDFLNYDLFIDHLRNDGGEVII